MEYIISLILSLLRRSCGVCAEDLLCINCRGCQRNLYTWQF